MAGLRGVDRAARHDSIVTPVARVPVATVAWVVGQEGYW